MNTSIQLNFIEKGSGKIVLLVPGWSQTAKSFQKQLDGLCDRYRVIAVDMRGHGDSPKPPTGYRIARLAQDLHDFIISRDLTEVNLAGHSMGSSIIWSYLEQFGSDRLAKLIFIDQAPLGTNGSGLEGQALKDAGAAFTPDALYTTANAIVANQGGVVDGFKGAFFSSSISDVDVAFNKAESLKMPAEFASRLLLDHCVQDWRDVVEHIVPGLALPTLVIGGGLGTIFPPDAATWIASKIVGSSLSIFSAAELGSHFMFWENPEKFNSVMREFIR